MARLPDTIALGAIELRRWRREHLDEVMTAVEASFEDLQRWMSWATEMPTRDEMLWLLEDGEAVFDKDEAWEYFIFEARSNEFVGMAGLNNSRTGPKAVEVSYWVRSDRSGRGYATSAARALVDAALTMEEIKWVEIRMDAANLASAAIPPKLGFDFARTEISEIRARAHTGRQLVWQL